MFGALGPGPLDSVETLYKLIKHLSITFHHTHTLTTPQGSKLQYDDLLSRLACNLKLRPLRRGHWATGRASHAAQQPQGRGVSEIKHSTNVESLPTAARVCEHSPEGAMANARCLLIHAEASISL